MFDSLMAELLLLRKRSATWTLLGFWTALALLFSYLLPYYAFTSNLKFHGREVSPALLITLLPQNLISKITSSFPFFGGTMVLILGALMMGSEFSWGTLTPVFTQRASRLKVFLSKMIALGLALIPFVLSVFILGLIASVLIAWREGQVIELPPMLDLVKALGTAWFILAAWATFGVLLATLSRGTSLAIGLGIIYGLVLENIINVFGTQIDLLASVSNGLLRTNSYSLISSLGASIQSEAGPGGFSGTLVSGTQAFWVLGVYIILFIAVSAILIRWRDVAGTS
ncbi:MAG: ABC transporter permease [Thermoleophilia bacterium]